MAALVPFLLLSVAVESFVVAPYRAHPTSLKLQTSLQAHSSKWDNLIDEEEDDEANVPFDMKYTAKNLQQQGETLGLIRTVGGKELINDLYARVPKSEIFYYIGKLARVSDVSREQAVARQWNLIVYHAAILRPLDLFPNKSILEIWMAPGNSELEVACNNPDIIFTKMSKDVPGAAAIKRSMIGFEGEAYGNDEEGFRTWRTDEGLPLKPHVKGFDPGTEKAKDEATRISKIMEGIESKKNYREEEEMVEEAEEVEEDIYADAE